MKEGQTINELASELMSIEARKLDVKVPTASLIMTPDTKLMLASDGLPEHIPTEFGITNWAHSQVSQYTDVPKAYYDRIKSQNPELLAQSVNHGLQMAIQRAMHKKDSENRMLRTIDGNVRGFLSSRYRRLDCHDLLNTVLPILLENQFNVVSCQLTEQRMYLKVVSPKIQGDIAVGQPVQYGLVISSSDVGSGSVRVEPLLYELSCTNGMVSQTNIRKFHIGKNQGGDSIEELLTDETKELNDKAFWATIHDLVKGSMEQHHFDKELNILREARDIPIKNMRLDKVVDMTMREVGITGEKHKTSILEHLANGAGGRGLNKWGLANCFTWAAQNKEANYEEATALERAGGKIITLSDKSWLTVAG